MGTALTGSTVASTYTGLLKTTDSATLTSSLKAICDGSGTDSALQLSTQAVNTSGDFSVATSKLTVASASGNTAVAGTLGVTGATTLSSTLGVTGAATLASVAVTGAATAASVATTGNISTSAGTITSYGAISQTQAGQNNSLAGNLAVTGNLNVTGVTTLSGNVSLPGNLAVTGDFAVNTNKFNVAASSGNTLVAGTLGVTGTTSVAAINASGNASITGTLGVTAATTLGDLSTTGNTVIGNQNTDLLTINSDNITVPNLTPVTLDQANDKLLILDATDSKVRLAAPSYPQCVQQVADDRYNYTGSVTAPGTEITSLTKSITPKTLSSKVLVSIVLNYSCYTNASQFILFRLTRNGTEIGTSIGSGQTGIASGSYEDGEVNAINNTKIEFFDSPSSTSAVTYKINIYSPLSAQPLFLNYAVSGTSNSTISTMTLQEYFA
ncbi:hypothetical protein EBT31_08710 [bacterium]|nr:hypothetical protein [bacterium]